MTGRLATPPGFTRNPWRGLGTRGDRLYLLYSIACQPNPDRARAERLVLLHALRTIASGHAPRAVPFNTAVCSHSRFFYEDCERCVEEYAGSILAATVNRKRTASVDTHPKDGDVKQAPLVSGAVPNGETPSCR